MLRTVKTFFHVLSWLKMFLLIFLWPPTTSSQISNHSAACVMVELTWLCRVTWYTGPHFGVFKGGKSLWCQQKLEYVLFIKSVAVAKLSFPFNKTLKLQWKCTSTGQRSWNCVCCPHNGLLLVWEATGPIKDDPDPKLFVLNAGMISASCRQRMWKACKLMIYWYAMLCNASQVASSTL